jgi:hypothetical protein
VCFPSSIEMTPPLTSARIDELRELDEQRKMLLPENMPDSDAEEIKEESPAGETTGLSEPEVNGHHDSDDDEEEEEEELPTRSLRRNSGRANERKRRQEEEAARKEKEKKEREAAKNSKQSIQFKKLLKDIDKKKEAIKKCEDDIAELDNDLREANCQRTKALGRDRYWNRYWWFERNGMPYAGMPDSSTAHYGYANGRLWIQGPDEMERDGFVDLNQEEMQAYRMQHGMTVPERERQELGETRLLRASEWAYIDSPKELDSLIGWLDERGKRERDLRKELSAWRDQIAQQMEKLKAHLEDREHKKLEAEEEATGIVTRHGRNTAEKDMKRHPCLEWKNTRAVAEIGRRHMDPPGPKKKKQQQQQQRKGIAEVVNKKRKAPEPTPEPTKSKKADVRSTRSSRR